MLSLKCKHCDGSKVVYKNNVPYKCQCVTVDEIKAYLTPMYVNANFTNSDSILSLVKNKFNVFCAPKFNWDSFKQRVKSFLIKTKYKYSHLTVTGSDIIGAFIQDHERLDVYKNKVNLLILKLDIDPQKSPYSSYVVSLLEYRYLNNKDTWVFSGNNIESTEFRDLYGNETCLYLKDKFKIATVVKASVQIEN